LAHIATADTARDLDHLRRLVDDRPSANPASELTYGETLTVLKLAVLPAARQRLATSG
jgi:hypothetical protein